MDDGFLGRARELSAFSRILSALPSGAGHLALVLGDPCMGKTRLVEQFATMAAAANVDVKWGRAWEGEGAPSYWPWIQALRPIIHLFEGDRPEGSAKASHETAGSVPPGAAEPLTEPFHFDSAAGRFRFFDSVTTSLAACASTRPLVLILEDLHWADRSSLALLEFIARDVVHLPVAIVATARADSWASEIFVSLARHRQVQLLNLSGLTDGEATALVHMEAGRALDHSTLTHLLELADGNPFFLIELARAQAGEEPPRGYRRELPVTVQDSISRRLDELPRDLRAGLEAGAVIGREFSAELLASITSPSTSDLARTLAIAEGLRLVHPGIATGTYRFHHALVREALYQGLDSHERRRLHLLAGTQLERVTLSSEAYVSEIARHFLLAGPLAEPARAAAWTIRAAREAMSRFAWVEAAEYFHQAYDLLDGAGGFGAPERFELRLARAEALDLDGQRSASWETFLEAAAIARSAEMWPELARAAIFAGDSRTVIGSRDTGVIDLLEGALTQLGETNQGLRAQLLSHLAKAIYDAGLADRADTLSAESLRSARQSGDPVALCLALDARRYVVWQPATAKERLAIGDEMVRLAAAAGLGAMGLLGSHTRIFALLDLGAIEALREEISRHREQADALRLAFWQCYNAMYRSALAQLQGDFAQSRALSEEFAALGRRVGVPSTELWLTGQVGILTWLQGAESEWIAVGRDPGPIGMAPAAAAMLAAMASEAGDSEQCRNLLARAFGPRLQTLPADFTRTATLAALACTTSLVRDEYETLYAAGIPNAGYNTMLGGRVRSGRFLVTSGAWPSNSAVRMKPNNTFSRRSNSTAAWAPCRGSPGPSTIMLSCCSPAGARHGPKWPCSSRRLRRRLRGWACPALRQSSTGSAVRRSGHHATPGGSDETRSRNHRPSCAGANESRNSGSSRLEREDHRAPRRERLQQDGGAQPRRGGHLRARP